MSHDREFSTITRDGFIFLPQSQVQAHAFVCYIDGRHLRRRDAQVHFDGLVLIPSAAFWSDAYHAMWRVPRHDLISGTRTAYCCRRTTKGTMELCTSPSRKGRRDRSTCNGVRKNMGTNHELIHVHKRRKQAHRTVSLRVA